MGSKNDLLKASKACCKRSGGCKRSEMQHFWPFASSEYRKKHSSYAGTAENSSISEFLKRLKILKSKQQFCAFRAVPRSISEFSEAADAVNTSISALSEAGNTVNSSISELPEAANQCWHLGIRSFSYALKQARLKKERGIGGGRPPPPMRKHKARIMGFESMMKHLARLSLIRGGWGGPPLPPNLQTQRSHQRRRKDAYAWKQAGTTLKKRGVVGGAPLFANTMLA